MKHLQWQHVAHAVHLHPLALLAGRHRRGMRYASHQSDCHMHEMCTDEIPLSTEMQDLNAQNMTLSWSTPCKQPKLRL